MRSTIACLSLAFALVAVDCRIAYPQDPEPAGTTEETVDPAEELAAAGDVSLDAEAIRTYQLELKARGYFFGPVDGRKGPRTRSALRNFQRAEGLTPSGSLDQATLDKLNAAPTSAPPTLTEAAPADEDPLAAGGSGSPEPASTESTPVADGSQPKSVSSQPGGVKKFFGAVGGGIKRGVGAVVGVGRTTADKAGDTGQAVGKAGAATGQAVGKAGTVTATATSKAAVAGAEAVKDVSVKVADTTVGAYQTGKKNVTGDRRTDEQIKRSLDMQYSEDERLEPSEIEVRVSDGNVTLALPQSPRSDVPHAVRLAKLTAGVKSVNTVFVAPKVIVDDTTPTEVDTTSTGAPAADSSAEPPPPQ